MDANLWSFYQVNIYESIMYIQMIQLIFIRYYNNDFSYNLLNNN